ncbi:MAG TPA: DUF262 domain-containing protein [Arcobacter sp.]|nr:DUF262 domain-containing protein [Arcobacter sp.]
MAKIKSKFTDDELEKIQIQIDKKTGLYDYITKDYPFEVIYTKYGDENDLEKTLYVPSYQREFVWDNEKQSRFIESVLLGVPLTPFLVSEDDNRRLEIIDGSQRIRTLIAFYENRLRLRKLDKLDKLNSAKYKDLPKKIQRYFENRDFKIIIVDEANSEIKQDIFNRINTSSEKLSDSEIRKGSYSGKFYDMVLELKDDINFLKVCPVSKKKADRGEREELILRFFAYADSYMEFKHDVAIFLNDYLDNMNESDFNKEEYLMNFNNMVNFIKSYFPIGFRKEDSSSSTPRVRFEAIAVGVHLALKENPTLENPNINWLKSEGFKIQTTSDSSNNPNRLKNRVEFVRDGLLGKLSSERLKNG